VTEADIKREIGDFLERHPDRVLFTFTPPKRTKYSSKFMRVGWPDIFGILRKSHVLAPFFIEVKKPGGALSVEQHKILERAKEWGAITLVATSVMDVRSALKL
jgi:hypothetical protein